MDGRGETSDQAQLPIGELRAYNARRMELLILFALGVLNFAANKAVLESDHPILDELPAFFRGWNGRVPLVAEFVVLLAALLFPLESSVDDGGTSASFKASSPLRTAAALVALTKPAPMPVAAASMLLNSLAMCIIGYALFTYYSSTAPSQAMS